MFGGCAGTTSPLRVSEGGMDRILPCHQRSDLLRFEKSLIAHPSSPVRPDFTSASNQGPSTPAGRTNDRGPELPVPGYSHFLTAPEWSGTHKTGDLSTCVAARDRLSARLMKRGDHWSMSGVVLDQQARREPESFLTLSLHPDCQRELTSRLSAMLPCVHHKRRIS
jgi:hypothetical protein